MDRKIDFLDLGRIDYLEAFQIQEQVHKKCCQDDQLDLVIFQENYPVFTVGRTVSGNHFLLPEDEIKKRGIDIIEVERGGDVTYHGPGQLVISPILHLKKFTPSIHQYLRNLEGAVIKLLSSYDIHAERVKGLSGCWVGNDKIAATGIAIKNGVTMHGIAINVNPNLEHFGYIIPCGLEDRGVTSMEKLGVSNVSMSEIKSKIKEELTRELTRVTAT